MRFQPGFKRGSKPVDTPVFLAVANGTLNAIPPVVPEICQPGDLAVYGGWNSQAAGGYPSSRKPDDYTLIGTDIWSPSGSSARLDLSYKVLEAGDIGENIPAPGPLHQWCSALFYRPGGAVSAPQGFTGQGAGSAISTTPSGVGGCIVLWFFTRGSGYSFSTSPGNIVTHTPGGATWLSLPLSSSDVRPATSVAPTPASNANRIATAYFNIT